MRAGGRCGLSVVAAEVVHHHHVAGSEGGSQLCLDIEPEGLAVDRPVEHEGRFDAVAAQGGDEGQGLPVAKGRVGAFRGLLYAVAGRALGYFSPSLPQCEGPEGVSPEWLFSGQAAGWGEAHYGSAVGRAVGGAR